MKALLEIIERDGRVGRTVDVNHWPVTLGRALGNDVVLDEPHVAAHHAQLQADEHGAVTLTVGDTRNGVIVGTSRHTAGQQVALPAAGAWLQLGGVKLRLRLPAETLAPERLLPAAGRRPWAVPLAAGGLLMALAAASHWLALDPGADLPAWLPVAVGLPLALAGWCGLWALVSKLFQHRFDFGGHLRIVLPWLLAIEGLDAVLTPLAAGLGWPVLWRLVAPLQVLLGLLMLRAHLAHVLPLSVRTVTAVLAVAGITGTVLSLTLTQRATDRFSRPPYMSTLPLPALDLAPSVSSRALVQDLTPLAQRLATRVKKAQVDEPAEGDGSSE